MNTTLDLPDECAHEARPGEEMTPERVADALLQEEAASHREPLR